MWICVVGLLAKLTKVELYINKSDKPEICENICFFHIGLGMGKVNARNPLSIWTKLWNIIGCMHENIYACRFVQQTLPFCVKETGQVIKWTYQVEYWPWKGSLKSFNDNFTLLNRIKLLWCHPSCLHQALIPTHAVPQSCIYTIFRIFPFLFFSFLIEKFTCIREMNLLLLEHSGIDGLWLLDQTIYHYRH